MRARLREGVRDRLAHESWVEPTTDEIEVLGFVRDRVDGLLVVWRDDGGTLEQMPAWAVRMIPNTVTPPDVNVGSLDPVITRRPA